MAKRGVKKIIFSSSASVYGDASIMPISEDCPPAPTNPYARSKLIIEQILQDIHNAAGMAYYYFALLQRSRSPSKRVDWQGSSGSTQQPHAFD